MRFWDSSAVVPLLLDERESDFLTKTLQEDHDLITWWGTSIECASAIRRRERADDLSAKDANRALARLATLEENWSEILPSSLVRSTAHRLLAVHPLRAADSLQLAAASAWRRSPIDRPDFVCLDERLADAAIREGFRHLPQGWFA